MIEMKLSSSTSPGTKVIAQVDGVSLKSLYPSGDQRLCKKPSRE